jgi:hypothetical protein
VLVFDESEEAKPVLIDSPNKANISPLRRHQRSINNFLDTMK